MEPARCSLLSGCLVLVKDKRPREYVILDGSATKILRADSYVWNPLGGLREDFFHATTVVFIYNPHEKKL